MAKLKFGDGSKLSHAYIVSALSEQERLDAARQIAAAAVCSGSGDRPCGLCRDCRKAAERIHPDIIGIRRLVDDKSGKPRKDLAVDQVREMAADAYVLPNEAGRKVYIIEEAEYMNTPAQNAALKLLEEPPAWSLFILCVPSASVLLDTVRSRCAEISLGGSAQGFDEASSKRVSGFIKAVDDRAALLNWCFANEGMDTRQLRDFIDCLYERLADMLCGRADGQGFDRLRLFALLELCEQCRDFLRVNTGVKHILGLLAVKAPEAGRNKRKDN